MTEWRSAADGLRDFDFLYGQWLVQNRCLQRPLSGSGSWDDFDAWYRCWPLLDGIGNVDEMHTDDGGPVHASLRLYHGQSRRWNLYRVCPREGLLQPPLQGAFRGEVGEFYGALCLDGRPIHVRYTWTKVPADQPRWERAFSGDGGATWENNWVVDFSRVNWPLELGHVDRQWSIGASLR